ncbi:DUF493 family protein [Marinilabiliaceae bacterium JC017]|nr:DUF493 family protein [Marinilabiliaceae bacterium JC017]
MATQDYEKLRKMLLENKHWPLLYMFKFIVPNGDDKVQKVVDILPKTGKFAYNHTKSLRYVAVTCKAHMNNADDIIEINNKVAAIPGVLSL